MATIKIVHISDTHLQPFNPEDGDILIHSGDALNYGSFEDLIRFRKQLESIKDRYKYIVYTPGNHDWEFENNFKQSYEFLIETIPNIIILHNSGIELLGLKFYGTADQPEFCAWAFNRTPDELMESYKNIPDDTEVLITHCPPYGILDGLMNGKSRVGSGELADRLPGITNLKLHAFGHIHYSRGMFVNNKTTFSNAAICDEYYSPVNKANVIEVNNEKD